MSFELSNPLRNALVVPAAVLLTACSGQTTTGAEQQPAPVEIKKSVVESLFRSAYVGTAEDKGCLWGKAYDTDVHLDEADLVPSGFQPAIPRVTNVVTADTSANMFVTPRGNDNEWIELEVKYSEGKVTFTGGNAVTNNTLDRLATLSCKKTISVPYQP
jgi:hypothetical protein